MFKQPQKKINIKINIFSQKGLSTSCEILRSTYSMIKKNPLQQGDFGFRPPGPQLDQTFKPIRNLSGQNFMGKLQIYAKFFDPFQIYAYNCRCMFRSMSSNINCCKSMSDIGENYTSMQDVCRSMFSFSSTIFVEFCTPILISKKD